MFSLEAVKAAVHVVFELKWEVSSAVCYIPWSCTLNLFGVWRLYANPLLRPQLVFLHSSSLQTSPLCLCDILCSLWLEGASSQSHSALAPELVLYKSEKRIQVRPMFSLEIKSSRKTYKSQFFALQVKIHIPKANSAFITCVHVLTGSSVISMVVESRIDTSPLITYWLGPSSSIVPLKFL